MRTYCKWLPTLEVSLSEIVKRKPANIIHRVHCWIMFAFAFWSQNMVETLSACLLNVVYFSSKQRCSFQRKHHNCLWLVLGTVVPDAVAHTHKPLSTGPRLLLLRGAEGWLYKLGLLRQPTYSSGFKNTNSSYPLLTLTDCQAPDVRRIKEEVYQVSRSTERTHSHNVKANKKSNLMPFTLSIHIPGLLVQDAVLFTN